MGSFGHFNCELVNEAVEPSDIFLKHLKEYYEIFSSSHLNRLLSYINTVPKTNLFPKYHISKHYRTCVKCDTKKNNKKDKK